MVLNVSTRRSTPSEGRRDGRTGATNVSVGRSQKGLGKIKRKCGGKKAAVAFQTVELDLRFILFFGTTRGDGGGAPPRTTRDWSGGTRLQPPTSMTKHISTEGDDLGRSGVGNDSCGGATSHTCGARSKRHTHRTCWLGLCGERKFWFWFFFSFPPPPHSRARTFFFLR